MIKIDVNQVEIDEWVLGANVYVGPRWITLNVDLPKTSIQFTYTRKSYRRKTT